MVETEAKQIKHGAADAGRALVLPGAVYLARRIVMSQVGLR